MHPTIPVVNLEDYHASGDRRGAFVRALGLGLEEFGFVAVLGHGIDPALIARAYATASEVFALPAETKARYETPHDGRQRGYTSFGVEHARQTSTPDLKEFWHVGRDLPADHPLTVSGEVPANLFPSEVPSFSSVLRQYFADIEEFANHLLDAIGVYMDYPPDFFRNLVRDGNTIVRVIHYPDDVPAVPGAVRAAEHEDINLITVLPSSTRPGLQLMTRSGEWMAVRTPPGVLVCDTGDMMALLTGGRLSATTHRVVNPEEADGGRLSMPMFVHPHPDAELCAADPRTGERVTGRSYLKERLAEIGVAG